MAERTAKPAAKKVAVSKAASAAAGKTRTLKAASVIKPRQTAAKKPASAAAKPGNAGIPATKKAVASAAGKKVAVQKTTAARTRPVAKRASAQPTPEERYRMVQTAAYFIAERNGFCGCPEDYWVAAELEIAGRLGL